MTPAGSMVQLLDGTQAAAHEDELAAAHAEVYSTRPTGEQGTRASGGRCTTACWRTGQKSGRR